MAAFVLKIGTCKKEYLINVLKISKLKLCPAQFFEVSHSLSEGV